MHSEWTRTRAVFPIGAEPVRAGLGIPRQGDVLSAVENAAEEMDHEWPVPRGHRDVELHGLEELLGLLPVRDEAFDRANLEVELPGKFVKFGRSRHRAVVVHDLADHTGWARAGESRKIQNRFRVSRADENATVFRA